MYINKDVPNSSIPNITKETFNLLKSQFGYNARMGDIINLIEKSTGINLEVDFKSSWNPMVFSRLLDYQKDFMGSGINLEELKDYIFNQFEISSSKIKLLNKNNIEDRLWAVMLSIALPSHDYFKLSDD